MKKYLVMLALLCSCTEQAHAPIDFETGLHIANNFFNVEGSMIAEEIVCDYVMDGNPKIMLWRQ